MSCAVWLEIAQCLVRSPAFRRLSSAYSYGFLSCRPQGIIPGSLSFGAGFQVLGVCYRAEVDLMQSAKDVGNDKAQRRDSEPRADTDTLLSPIFCNHQQTVFRNLLGDRLAFS